MVHMALELAEAVVKNGDARVHREVATAKVGWHMHACIEGGGGGGCGGGRRGERRPVGRGLFYAPSVRLIDPPPK